LRDVAPIARVKTHALHIARKSYALRTLKPICLVPRLVFGKLMDRGNPDTDEAPSTRDNPPFRRAKKPLGVPRTVNFLKAF
jgi:hypothetical protein